MLDPGTQLVTLGLPWVNVPALSAFDLDKLGRVLDSEDETEHSGWALGNSERTFEVRLKTQNTAKRQT